MANGENSAEVRITFAEKIRAGKFLIKEPAPAAADHLNIAREIVRRQREFMTRALLS